MIKDSARIFLWIVQKIRLIIMPKKLDLNEDKSKNDLIFEKVGVPKYRTIFL